jgi:hypothetical protein
MSSLAVSDDVEIFDVLASEINILLIVSIGIILSPGVSWTICYDVGRDGESRDGRI